MGAVVAIATATVAFPTAAQEVVDRYLDSLTSFGIGRAEVISIDRARRPWNLSADSTDYPVFDAGRYCQGDERYEQLKMALETPLWSDKIVTTSSNDCPALPYPPEELWCGLLSSGGQEQVIWIARHHREPYYTEWVIHQGPLTPFPESLHDTLITVGCELGDLP
jgi:hypothetical protein